MRCTAAENVISAGADFYIMHLSQTSNTIQTFAFLFSDKHSKWLLHVENTLEEKSWQERRGLSCLLHLRCMWSQSVTNTAFTSHVKKKRKGFIWSQQHHGAPSVPAQKYCREKQQKSTDVRYFSHKQTPDICRLAHWTLHLVLLSKSTFWLSQVILVWGHMKGWCEEVGFQK